MEQLLWLETLIKGATGTALLLSPKIIIRLFALPDSSSSSFWPRLTGALLVGLAAVIFMSGAKLIDDGVGLAGLAILNFCAATILVSAYWSPKPGAQRRGKSLLGFLALALYLLAIAEFLVR